MMKPKLLLMWLGMGFVVSSVVFGSVLPTVRALLVIAVSDITQ